MTILKFKTNINCGHCVATVTPFLNGEKKIQQWQVETGRPEKILTVQGEDIDANMIVQVVQKAGYKAEPMDG